MRLGTLALCAAASLALSACGTYRPGPANVPAMGVRTFFSIEHVCSLGVSPPINLDGAPGSAARYRVRFTNTSVLYAPATEYEVAADGPAIAQGALNGYRGPCPGETANFMFRIEVLALDANGRSVAYGFANVPASNPSRIVRGPAVDRPQMPPPPGQRAN
ncbi:MAG: hypothetical protein O9277_11325 [Magnetospirillum sp.]|nr:hypothetical protein [Magnetospirillum sp.]